MKTLIWKELRENALWAAIVAGVLILGLAAFQILTAVNTIPPSTAGSTYTHYVAWLEMGAPFAALALGLLQIVPELGRDHWAFLIHRPASPRAIFLGKAAAGLGLYLAATLIPLAVVSIWFSIPGNFAGPFDASLALPGIAAIVAGVPFYFAAVLVAFRPARWWGSRLLPIVTAVCGAAASAAAPEFADAIAFGATLTCVMGFAALGAFEAAGEYEGQAKPQRFCLGAVMMVGFVAAACTAVAVAGGIIGAMTGSNALISQGGGTRYVLTQNGRFFQLTASNTGDIIRASDAAGNTVVIPSHAQDLDNSGPDIFPHNTMYTPAYTSYDRSYQILQMGWGPGYDVYYAYDNRNRILHVYSSATQRQTGYVGADGVLSDRYSTAAAFPDRILSTYAGYVQGDIVLLFPHALYAVSAKQPGLRLFAAAPSGQAFTSATSTQNFVCAVTKSTVLLFDLSGTLVIQAPYSENPKDFSWAQVFVTHPSGAQGAPRLSLLYFNGVGGAASWIRAHPWWLVAYSATGAILSRTPVYSVQTYEQPKGTDAAEGAIPAMFIPVGVFAGGVAIVGAVAACDHSFRDATLRSLAWNAAIEWSLIWLAVGTLLSVLPAIAIGRLYGWNRGDRWRWTVALALLGWPMMLTLLAMVPLPERIRCRSCGKMRRVGRITCEHCGAALPSPIASGTEIFERSEPVGIGNTSAS
jgi:hypothetical protein